MIHLPLQTFHVSLCKGSRRGSEAERLTRRKTGSQRTGAGMFTAASNKITTDWINPGVHGELLCSHTMKYHSAIKRTQLHKHATTQMNLKNKLAKQARHRGPELGDPIYRESKHRQNRERKQIGGRGYWKAAKEHSGLSLLVLKDGYLCAQLSKSITPNY